MSANNHASAVAHSRPFERLELEYRHGDELLLGLAARASDDTLRDTAWSALTDTERSTVCAAANAAARRIGSWRPDGVPPGLLPVCYAIADAVTAEIIRSSIPHMARELALPWETAIGVRARLQELGPAVESIALRLLPHWLAELEALPWVAQSLV